MSTPQDPRQGPYWQQPQPARTQPFVHGPGRSRHLFHERPKRPGSATATTRSRPTRFSLRCLPRKDPSEARSRKLALTSGAAVLAAAAIAVPAVSQPARAQSSPIQHVIVIDLENHSWDNVLGYWCQGNPRCGPGDAMPASVTLSNGAVVTPSVTPDVVPDIGHYMASQVKAMDGGKMDGWQKVGRCTAATGYQCISGYLASAVPNLTSLAGAYALEDRFFSLKDSPSWGGHMYAVAGTTDGFTGDIPVRAPGVKAHPGWGCDSHKVASWGSGSAPQGPDQPSCVPDFSLGLPNGGVFEPTIAQYVPTIMDRLDAAGLTWRIYGSVDRSDPGYIWNTCATFAECLDTSQKLNVAEPSQFFADAAAGTLPDFSLVVAGGQNEQDTSCHNGMSMTACDNYIGQLASAVMNSPDWPSTALFITFDDFGGFYDNQPPPVNPDGTQEGPRLPLIAVSPYAIPASTDSTPASFASILAFTENNFGLAPLGPNDAAAYDLSGMFGLSAGPRLGGRPHMVTRPVPKGDHIVWSELKQAS